MYEKLNQELEAFTSALFALIGGVPLYFFLLVVIATSFFLGGIFLK